MSDEPPMGRIPDPIPGPIVCPSWCSRPHTARDDNVEDGIMHVSEPIRWDMPEYPENAGAPVIRFELVSFERPQGHTPPVVEVSAGPEDDLPDSLAVRDRAELDQLIAELERTAVALRNWRGYLPYG